MSRRSLAFVAAGLAVAFVVGAIVALLFGSPVSVTVQDRDIPVSAATPSAEGDNTESDESPRAPISAWIVTSVMSRSGRDVTTICTALRTSGAVATV